MNIFVYNCSVMKIVVFSCLSGTFFDKISQNVFKMHVITKVTKRIFPNFRRRKHHQTQNVSQQSIYNFQCSKYLPIFYFNLALCTTTDKIFEQSSSFHVK